MLLQNVDYCLPETLTPVFIGHQPSSKTRFKPSNVFTPQQRSKYFNASDMMLEQHVFTKKVNGYYRENVAAQSLVTLRYRRERHGFQSRFRAMAAEKCLYRPTTHYSSFILLTLTMNSVKQIGPKIRFSWEGIPRTRPPIWSSAADSAGPRRRREDVRASVRSEWLYAPCKLREIR